RLGEGAPCNDRLYQCEPDLFCKAGWDHAGTCTKLAVEGDPCEPAACGVNKDACAICAPGLLCPAGNCTSKLPAMGELCPEDHGAAGAACVKTSPDTTCGPLVDDGKSCDWDSDCKSGDCWYRRCWPKCELTQP